MYSVLHNGLNFCIHFGAHENANNALLLLFFFFSWFQTGYYNILAMYCVATKMAIAKSFSDEWNKSFSLKRVVYGARAKSGRTK